ncbi:hypothetical protein [Streptomyces sp. NPDC058092]|uniref:hypothetical protein n=1 Tax=Streptomyces sp. NPDC058092 TaxID=3346336 RepID=UPI0036E7D14E
MPGPTVSTTGVTALPRGTARYGHHRRHEGNTGNAWTRMLVLRRGHYDIEALFRRDGGRYGRWSVPGLVAYVLGFAVMVPFFSVPGLFVGPVASALDETDLSAFVGLLVSAGLYAALAPSAGRRAETAPLDTARGRTERARACPAIEEGKRGR